jgi:hypothetical protein
MTLFKKNNIPYSKHHLEEADNLINSVHIYAVSTYNSMLNEFPEIVSVVDSNLLSLWEYLITIAGVGTAFMEIADTVSDKKQVGITYAIQKKLYDWHSESYEAMVNFINYTSKLVANDVEVPDAIGGWIWINLEKHQQANQELIKLASSLKLVRPVGLSISITIHNWWKQK